MRHGTAYFPSLANAGDYYHAYGFSLAQVRAKIADKEIFIGQPELKPGQKLVLMDDGNRYGIEEGE